MTYDDWRSNNELTRTQLEERVSELERERDEARAERDVAMESLQDVRDRRARVAAELRRRATHRGIGALAAVCFLQAADLVERGTP